VFPQKEIEGFERYWRRRKPGTSTAVHYSSDVRIFFKWAEQSPEAITVHQVDGFIDWQRGLGRASTTIQRRLVALRMFYDYLAYAQDRKIPNPVLPRRHYIARGRHLPRDVCDEVIERLFEAIGTHLRDRVIFTVMLHAGLRVSEVTKLRVSDVKLSGQRTPTLRVNGKGECERIVFLSATATQLLAQYLESRPEDGPERVFLNRKGKPITVTGIQLQLAHYCRKAGIWVTCHQLRHTFGRPFGRLVNSSLDETCYQKQVSSPWRFRAPSRSGLVSFQGT
jgi:site-specific recombinase XerD